MRPAEIERAMELPSDLFSRRPEEAARLIALSLLSRLSRARHRLDDAGDADALHDFRVALRRLRSAFRAHRHWLTGSVGRDARRTLRALARLSNPARDAEVQIAWLSTQLPSLPPAFQAELRSLIEHLEAEQRGGARRLLSRARRRLPAIERQLARALSVFRAEATFSSRPDFRQALAAAVERHGRELLAALERVDSDEKSEGADRAERSPRSRQMELAHIHAARIQAKRLRYLLEPPSLVSPPLRPAVERLTALQDLLGELHDAQLLEARLGTLHERRDGDATDATDAATNGEKDALSAACLDELSHRVVERRALCALELRRGEALHDARALLRSLRVDLADLADLDHDAPDADSGADRARCSTDGEAPSDRMPV